MLPRSLRQLLPLLALVAGPPALAEDGKFAGLGLSQLPCRGVEVTVRHLTNYSPSAGGINGHCGTSSFGYNACDHSIDKFLRGGSFFVMGAVPQKGGTSYMYGGTYEARLSAYEDVIKVFVGDRYDTKSNGLSKMDLVTDHPRGENPDKINSSPKARYTACGRLFGLRESRRPVQRDPAAVAPLAPRRGRKGAK